MVIFADSSTFGYDRSIAQAFPSLLRLRNDSNTYSFTSQGWRRNKEVMHQLDVFSSSVDEFHIESSEDTGDGQIQFGISKTISCQHVYHFVVFLPEFALDNSLHYFS